MKEYVSWEDVDRFITSVSNRVNSLEFSGAELDGVYGLPRGGLVFAVMLSHRLDLPLLLAPTNRSLIVDDICDSGESLVHYVNNSSSEDKHKQRPLVCTMYYKENALNVVPDYYMKEKSNKWIVFPWESED